MPGTLAVEGPGLSGLGFESSLFDSHIELPERSLSEELRRLLGGDSDPEQLAALFESGRIWKAEELGELGLATPVTEEEFSQELLGERREKVRAWLFDE